MYLYEKNTVHVNYSDFVNKELVLFSNLDNERSIPSLVDGFKPGQRKVMFTCIKRNDKKEVKVAQLAGSVGEHSAYHHGEASLMGTIIGLAQNFVGSNNINLLMPHGQFGTRLQVMWRGFRCFFLILHGFIIYCLLLVGKREEKMRPALVTFSP